MDDEMDNEPANMLRNKMTQKRDSTGNIKPYWARQDASKKKDIIAGFKENVALGWYDAVIDPKSQANAQQALNEQGIATRDWAEGEVEKPKNKTTMQSLLELGKSKLAVRRKDRAKTE